MIALPVSEEFKPHLAAKWPQLLSPAVAEMEMRLGCVV